MPDRALFSGGRAIPMLEDRLFRNLEIVNVRRIYLVLHLVILVRCDRSSYFSRGEDGDKCSVAVLDLCWYFGVLYELTKIRFAYTIVLKFGIILKSVESNNFIYTSNCHYMPLTNYIYFKIH